MTRDHTRIHADDLLDDQMIDFANEALDPEDRIVVARSLSHKPDAAAQTFSYIADREELLLALGVAKRVMDFPTLPAPMPKRRKSRWQMGGLAVASGLTGAVAMAILLAGPAINNGPAAEIIRAAIRANNVAQLRLSMQTMDEDTQVDRAEIERIAGLELPGHPADWVVRDTQVLPAAIGGVSIMQTFESATDGVVTLYVVQGGSDDARSPTRLSVPDGEAAWFRHDMMDYILIARDAKQPLDDEAGELLASFTQT